MNFHIYFVFLALITWGDFAFGCSTSPAYTCKGNYFDCLVDEAACKSAGLEMNGSLTCENGVCCKATQKCAGNNFKCMANEQACKDAGLEMEKSKICETGVCCKPTKKCGDVEAGAQCQAKCSHPSKNFGPAKDCEANDGICCKQNSHTCVGYNFECMKDESKCKRNNLEMDKSKTCENGVCCRAKVNCVDHDAKGLCQDTCYKPSSVLGPAKDCESNNKICCLPSKACSGPAHVCFPGNITCADKNITDVSGTTAPALFHRGGLTCSGGGTCCNMPYRCDSMESGYQCKNIEECKSAVLSHAKDCTEEKYCCQ